MMRKRPLAVRQLRPSPEPLQAVLADEGGGFAPPFGSFKSRCGVPESRRSAYSSADKKYWVLTAFALLLAPGLAGRQRAP